MDISKFVDFEARMDKDLKTHFDALEDISQKLRD